MAPYLFLSPFVGLFLVFGVFPIVFSFYLMFQVWDPVQGLDSMKYVGFDNLAFAVQDPLVWLSLKNTIWLAVASGLPQHLVAIPLAYFINEALGKWRNVAMGSLKKALKPAMMATRRLRAAPTATQAVPCVTRHVH